ncbi:MAG: response regulator [Gemmatimonadetes bacterium]|nr:response regulator [Gemmatimonadota bacterium]
MEVLLVDDDPAVRHVVGKALGRAGFEVTAVDNGLAALAAIQTHSYGVVVTDIRMDFLDGIRLYQELEAEFPELQERVVFVSAWSEDPDVDAFVQRTGRPLLRKPFELADLVALVRDTAAIGAERGEGYVPFSSAEAADLRTMGVRSGGNLACPRCGGALSVRSVAPQSEVAGWELRCHLCRRSLAVLPVLRPGDRRANRAAEPEPR